MKKIKKGFTLIELLIVIGIIGLLATLAIVSLTSAQRRARDTKRVADMKSLQTAFELYWSENATYPKPTGTTTWDLLLSDDTKLQAVISGLPTDPNNAATTPSYYSYLVNTLTGNEYYIGADLENTTHQGLTQDTDGSLSKGDGWMLLISSGDEATAGTTDVPVTLDCADTTGMYCLHGVATQ